MNKLLLNTILILMPALFSAQSESLIDSNLNAVNEENVKTEKKLILKTTDYPILTFESLKDELISWKEKVKSVELNEANQQFILVHFSTLENRELFDLLTKYNIEKNAIVSYK